MSEGVSFEAPIENEMAWTVYGRNQNDCAFEGCKGVPDYIIVQVSADCSLPHEIRFNVACETHMQMVKDEEDLRR